ncbi:FbpB family small basic protein [Metabacillus sp. GX 13764]|nr:FbpB family small basic protein [Metabacillus kandeliae]MCD7033651.1 FbpB family small basic protein [Metabacillus kandeliae]
MRKIKKLTFEELVQENKKELLKDEAFLSKVEDKIEQRFTEK